MAGDVNDADMYSRLGSRLAEIEQARRTGGNVLFYLSTQPSQYGPTAKGLGAAGLARGNGWRRLVVEKPFGHDLDSARALSRELQEVFPESEVYRIDHYLGKETVQNILAFRLGNGIFEPLWNRRYVNHVQITAAESIGVEGRGAYYQEAGALRDMIQNHLLQVMATIAMEPSGVFEPTAVRDERAKLLRSIRILKPDEVAGNAVPGQYGPARIGGVDVPGFRQEKGVDPNSQTDTYAAVTFLVDNWRWAGVPFYIRTGKHLPKRVSEIAIQFNPAPHSVFGQNGDGAHAQSAHPAHPAGGGHLAEVPVQAARRGNEAAARLHGFQLRLELRRALSLGLRDAAARRDPRRRHALHAAGYGGGELGRGQADHGSMARRPSSTSPITPPEPGDRRQSDEMLARRGHEWRNA